VSAAYYTLLIVALVWLILGLLAVRSMRATVEAPSMDAMFAELDRLQPEWRAYIAQPGFTVWLERQTPEVRGYAHSMDPKRAALLIQMYKLYLRPERKRPSYLWLGAPR
jgi:hypothetical protein